MDKPEIGDAILTEVLPNLCTCLKIQVENLGGVPVERSVTSKQNAPSSKTSARDTTGSSGGVKKSGKRSQKLEVLQSANLFFSCLSPEQLWQWIESLLSRAITASAGDVVRNESQTAFQRGVGMGGVESEKGGVGSERGGVERGGVGTSTYYHGVPSDGVIDAGSLPSSPVCPSSPDTVSGGGRRGGEGGLQLSCSSSCKLIRFLLQVLPLVNTMLLMELHDIVYSMLVQEALILQSTHAHVHVKFNAHVCTLVHVHCTCKMYMYLHMYIYTCTRTCTMYVHVYMYKCT